MRSNLSSNVVAGAYGMNPRTTLNGGPFVTSFDLLYLSLYDWAKTRIVSLGLVILITLPEAKQSEVLFVMENIPAAKLNYDKDQTNKFKHEEYLPLIHDANRK